MSSLRAIISLGVMLMLFTVLQVSAAPMSESSSATPSMDDQIKKKLEPIELLFQYGMVRNILKEIISKQIADDQAKNITKDPNFPERILDIVMKENTWMEGNRYTLKRELKKDFNNGTLTNEEVEKVFAKMLDILTEKTKVEIGKALEELRYGEVTEVPIATEATVPRAPKLNV
uniref:Uncharacterized protein n=2 Tax=Cacopsylla melanoneura TaxID=428564 RepID=A0A8D8R3Z5_9HEMI